MKTARTLIRLLIVGCFALTWVGCEKRPLEKAGKAVDDKIEDIKR